MFAPFLAILMVVLLGMVTLAVDLGYIMVVKAQLQAVPMPLPWPELANWPPTTSSSTKPNSLTSAMPKPQPALPWLTTATG